jgi:drug/metabolite transporter (DMT)-like permease
MSTTPSSDEKKGVALSLISAASAAGFLIPYKAALGGGHILGPLFVLLFSAAVFNTLGSLRGFFSGVRLDAFAFKVALILAFFTLISNWASIRAIAILEPAIVSALLQTQVLYVALVGRLVLKEALGLSLLFGILSALAGVLVLRYPADSSVEVGWLGILYVNIAAFGFGMLHVTTRKVISRIHPLSINALRLWISVVGLALMPEVRSDLSELRPEAAALTALAAFLGPFLSRITLMYSARHIEAAKAVLLALTSPVFALVLGAAFLDSWPTGLQLAGCTLVVLGVLVPLVGGRRAAS